MAPQGRTERNLRDLITAAVDVFSKKKTSTTKDLEYLASKAGRVLDEEGDGATVQVEAVSMDAGFQPIRIIIQRKEEPSPFTTIDDLMKALREAYEIMEQNLRATREAIATTAITLDTELGLPKVPEDIRAELLAVDGAVDGTGDVNICAAWAMLRDMEADLNQWKQGQIVLEGSGEYLRGLEGSNN
jgi:hypothetical protein